MADQDYPSLYADMEESAQRTRAAAIAFEQVLGGPLDLQVPVNGFGNQPTLARRVEDRMGPLVNTIELAAESVKRFAGFHPSAPSTRYDGSPLQPGDEYQNTTTNLRYSWSGTVWAPLNASVQQLILDLAAPAGAGLQGFDESQAYPAGTVGTELKAVNAEVDALDASLAVIRAPGFKRQQRSFIDGSVLSNLGNLTALNTAVAAGTVRWAWVGDSIVEGDRDGVQENSVASVLMRILREQNPNINFIFANFSLAGRGIPTYSDPNYKGIAGPTDAPESGFYRAAGSASSAVWPGGSVVGKSWQDHVRDFAPDMVVLMFGANDLSGSGIINAAQLKSALDAQNLWAKPPSVALATAALPAVAAGYQNEVQIAANSTRGVARERKLTLIDVNRLFNLHRAATDVENLLYLRDDGFAGYPTGWTPDAGSTLATTESAGIGLQGQGGAMRNKQSQDVNISAKFTMPNWTTQTGNIRYRSQGTSATQYTAQITAGSVFLYWGATIIGSSVIPTVPNGTEVTLQVDARGCVHRLFVNGAQVLEVVDYGNVRGGTHGFMITGGTGTVFSSVAHLGSPYAVGVPELSDLDIYGANDFATNPDSLGGNAINHPTALANRVIWSAAFVPLLLHVRSLRDVKTVDVISPVHGTGAGDFAVAGTTLQLEIAGVLGGATGVVALAGGAFAVCHDSQLVTGNQTIAVRVFHSPGTYFLTVNVPLPKGAWLVTAHAQFTKDSVPVIRNSIVVTAVRVS